MNSRTGAARQTSRIPVRARRGLTKRQSPVGLTAHSGIAFVQLDFPGGRIQGISGEQFDFLRDLLCAFRNSIDDDRGETVRIVPRSNRPRARRGIDLSGHINFVWMQPERVRYDLRCNCRVALPVRAAA
jgi:hypothetical protein